MVMTEKTVLLVMEFVSNGCLRDYLKKHKTSPDELLRFGFEVIEVIHPLFGIIICQSILLAFDENSI